MDPVNPRPVMDPVNPRPVLPIESVRSASRDRSASRRDREGERARGHFCDRHRRVGAGRAVRAIVGTWRAERQQSGDGGPAAVRCGALEGHRRRDARATAIDCRKPHDDGRRAGHRRAAISHAGRESPGRTRSARQPGASSLHQTEAPPKNEADTRVAGASPRHQAAPRVDQTHPPTNPPLRRLTAGLPPIGTRRARPRWHAS
jgi:hypothetical protein